MTLSNQKILEYYESQRGEKNMADIAAELGMSFKALDGKLYRARKALETREGTKHPYKPEPFNVELGSPLQLSGDFAIVGDVHIPATDYDFAQMVTAVASVYMKKPRRLIIAGDFWNFDFLSSYAHIVPPASWKHEREAGRQLVKEWRECFDEIYWIMGNHDRRLQKWMMGQYDDEDLRELLQSDGVRVSNFGYCTVRTDNGDWRVTHPKNYSINRLAVANDLAQKFDVNVISFHEHHIGVSLDRYGQHVIVNGGCLVDPEKLAYVMLDDSKAAAMAKGFVILQSGYPYLFAEKITDWKRWI